MGVHKPFTMLYAIFDIRSCISKQIVIVRIVQLLILFPMFFFFLIRKKGVLQETSLILIIQVKSQCNL